MKNLSVADKRMMLTDAVILSYKVGSYCTNLLGHNLSFYDFDKVFNLIKELNDDSIQMGNNDFFEGMDDYYGYTIK